jgi:GTP-binding protein
MQQQPTATTTTTTLRTLAFVTGHKKTARRNQKRRQAIAEGDYRSKGKPGKQNGRRTSAIRKRDERVAKLRQKYKDPSRDPDYPVPRSALGNNNNNNQDNNTQQQQQQQPKPVVVEAPPAVLLPTASPYVYVAKVACQESETDPQTLFASIPVHTDLHLAGSFEYFGQFPGGGGTSRNYPDGTQPEVAFLGRSNVGKSSLINAVMRQKLALTSKHPGRTQQPYYYGWISAATRLQHGNNSSGGGGGSITYRHAGGFVVDLPGYGYAIGPDRAVSRWQAATQAFLLHRRDADTLKRVYVLQDARLQIPQSMDLAVQSWLDEADIPYTVVLTKADDQDDRTGRTAAVVKHANLCLLRYQQHWAEQAPEFDGDTEGSILMSPFVHATSARKGTGLAELLASINESFAEAAEGD